MQICKWLVLALFATIISIKAESPSCISDSKSSRYIECSPSNTDYILDKGLVSDNKDTVSITLRRCRITSLNTDSFDGLPSLEKLDISDNKITTLPLGVLDKVPKLINLNASFNLITDLPVGLFDQIPNLLQLDLTGNLLKKLDPGVIKKTSMLHLSNNLLQGKDLKPDVFKTGDVNFLLLNKNNMEDAPDNILSSFRELVYLNLEGCSLTKVPKFVTIQNLDTITHLTLADNKIRKISDGTIFKNLNDLEVLNLTKNLIEQMDENLFSSTKKLKTLDLSMNRLSTIAEYQFTNLPILNEVNLSNNLITILPVNAFRATKISKLNLSDNKITYLQDNFCLELKNSGVVLRNFYFSRNPWQCACLKELMREVNVMNVQYDSNNYNGERPVCVTAGLFVCLRQPDVNQDFINMYDNI
ncbi:carboxypeptidase N subunit 2-like isoform X1 [Battus philenor]|uniref:carboxypeptidase N subunit 2-like isoform X1 n=1 Tax=Battus philenor TaxID=42288 RepID=UPI0035CF62F6